ncbi:Uncharacterized protein TCM_036481 [Theobroma cacao]|uniref:RNase H type-1 domain-containing protein n=1 Tax=Theobroma cacao TaxID=3641 RepID=A0A061FK91_THECC|nr:Uncharacterized protein TCM_036481 [Theobroma cacao]
MKFNIDGLAKGCLGPTGIGGIIRNESGEVKINFSKPIGMDDSSQVEIMAVKEVILIFFTSKWKESHLLIIESDASNVVNWVNNGSQVPWRLRKWVILIKRIKEQLGPWEIKHVPRETNQEANTLAKNAMSLGQSTFCVF